ncbi:unnamed protein product [Withania somnifera]
MPPEAKRHCCESLSLDILSNLPENVIGIILMCLPFRDAVRTNLTLDDTVWKTKKDSIFHTTTITKIIDHILIFHEGPITKFTLCVPKYRSCPMIDDLIYFLTENGIQDLVLKLPFEGEIYELPPSFFKSLQLRNLILQNCVILRPLTFKGFDRVISLELCEVTISSELLGSLISHCFLLEHLLLHIAETYCNFLEINAPRLRSSYFAGSVRSIFLKNIPLLAKLSLIFAAEASELPIWLPYNLHCVKTLDKCVDLYNSFEVSCALCLIRSFHMQLAKLLLVKSPMLERMLFMSSVVTGLEAVKKLAAELTTYQHASTKAEVVFIDN